MINNIIIKFTPEEYINNIDIQKYFFKGGVHQYANNIKKYLKQDITSYEHLLLMDFFYNSPVNDNFIIKTESNINEYDDDFTLLHKYNYIKMIIPIKEATTPKVDNFFRLKSLMKYANIASDLCNDSIKTSIIFDKLNSFNKYERSLIHNCELSFTPPMIDNRQIII